MSGINIELDKADELKALRARVEELEALVEGASATRPGKFTTPMCATCATCGVQRDARDLYCANGYQCRECYEQAKGEKKS
jgi:hypothetical protein